MSIPRTLRIRNAAPGDETGIFRLIGELAQFERLEHQLTGTEERLAEHLFDQPPRAECLVAEAVSEPGQVGGLKEPASSAPASAGAAKALVGYALFFTTYSTFLTQPGLWLEDVFVTEMLRGRGIGRALLSAVAEQARLRGAGRLEWSVLDWNDRAIRFYQSQGAQLLPDWRICRMGRDVLACVNPEAAGGV